MFILKSIETKCCRVNDKPNNRMITAVRSVGKVGGQEKTAWNEAGIPLLHIAQCRWSVDVRGLARRLSTEGVNNFISTRGLELPYRKDYRVRPRVKGATFYRHATTNNPVVMQQARLDSVVQFQYNLLYESGLYDSYDNVVFIHMSTKV